MCRRYLLIFLALPLFLAPSARPLPAADAKANELDMKTERVIVFKDGYCLFIKKATATTDKNGEAFTDDVPIAVLGSSGRADEGRWCRCRGVEDDGKRPGQGNDLQRNH